jgi:hypothetical protein
LCIAAENLPLPRRDDLKEKSQLRRSVLKKIRNCVAMELQRAAAAAMKFFKSCHCHDGIQKKSLEFDCCDCL